MKLENANREIEELAMSNKTIKLDHVKFQEDAGRNYENSLIVKMT